MNTSRRFHAREVRIAAAELAASRVHPKHYANGDEQKFRTPGTGDQPSYLASFTKGMRHNYDTGLLENPNHFQQFVKGIDQGDPRDFIDTPLGPDNFAEGENPDAWCSDKARGAADLKLRAWESGAAGNTFDLEGPDAQAVTMPPAPALGSHELIAEMGEVYAQALLRDVPFTKIVEEVETYTVECPEKNQKQIEVGKILDALKCLPWFASNDGCKIDVNGCVYHLSSEERSRIRLNLKGQTLFRGITPGDEIGPYISQFLLAGNTGLNGNGMSNENLTAADGYINYGAITIDQRVRFAKPCDDHMTAWDEWFDVQQAADFSGMEEYGGLTDKHGNTRYRRFITTPRDMATYVHYDALYEAYLNACLILLGEGVPFDPGIPFQRPDHIDHQQGFAHFGGPHILSLVTEVATRALKAVRHQKFGVHRRARPEVLAARLAKQKSGDLKVPELACMIDPLQPILDMVHAHNGPDSHLPQGNYLLPMAFCEGSPMHPSYGAGHATVAGACVTILKAFFDHKHPLTLAGDEKTAFVPTEDGLSLEPIQVIGGTLTVEGELNKLASNISIGRDWAGVHYFTDYIESLRMGEQIAIGILEEQKLTYGETFSMTVPLYDGGAVRI